MKSELVQRALQCGFDECRITTAAPPSHAAELSQWLERGWHGEMGYLPRQAAKRIDPQKVLPAAKSIICLAASYARFAEAETAAAYPKAQFRHGATIQGQVGAVARYARFADYHKIIARALRELTDWMQTTFPESASLSYVDTGPVQEKDLAQRAGLGFVGKHTNLINRGLGNWFFIAEIITTAQIEPDPPEPNRCGSCSRCMAACPTRAIPAPFQLDARRCISYLTIELKGAIPVELRPLIGNRIYGCDDCLAVCPWNRFAREGKLMRNFAKPELDGPDLIELLSLDERSFNSRFADSPIRRSKRRGLLRNVCVALGNTAGTEALADLKIAARDAEPLITEHARWAIQQIEARAQLAGAAAATA